MAAGAVQDIVDAISRLDAMSDKVAAFSIGQNFVWIIAALKNDLVLWMRSRRWWFIGGSLVAVAVYTIPEYALYREIVVLIGQANYGGAVDAILDSYHTLFVVRAAGTTSACILAALAFWGVTRPA